MQCIFPYTRWLDFCPQKKDYTSCKDYLGIEHQGLLLKSTYLTNPTRGLGFCFRPGGSPSLLEGSHFQGQAPQLVHGCTAKWRMNTLPYHAMPHLSIYRDIERHGYHGFIDLLMFAYVCLGIPSKLSRSIHWLMPCPEKAALCVKQFLKRHLVQSNS